MRLTRANKPKKKSDESGVALFMVIGAVSILALLVTEFTYVAQMNEQLAFDAMDGVKALYLAKSAVKLSLLRLKAYQTVKDLVGGSSSGKSGSSGGGGGLGISVPHSVLDKIWSFPFMFPLPTNIPGMMPSEKDKIEKFQKNSNFEGSFSSIIESESSRLNINSILPNFAPSPSPSPSTPPPTTVQPGQPPTQPNPASGPSPQPSYDPTQARQSLAVYFQNLINSKSEDNPDFATEYRDVKIDDIMDQITGWADPTYESRNLNATADSIPQKHAPFYSLSELHMIDGIDDNLYDVFTPGLTASKTPGLNINTMNQATLKALVPQMTTPELTDFFKYRDDDTTDNAFKSADDFYSYLSNSVAAFKGNTAAITQLKEDLAKRNIPLVTDETEFKITVTAQVGNASRKIEVWVRLRKLANSATGTTGNPKAPTPSPTPASGGATDNGQPLPDPGIKITYMRIS